MKKALLAAILAVMCVVAMSGCVVQSPAAGSEQAGFWQTVSQMWVFNMFVFGGIGFWAFVAVWFIILSIFCKDESDLWLTMIILLIAGVLGMWILGAFNPFILLISWIAAHPLYFVLIVLSYPVIGFAWASLKTIDLGHKLAKELNAARAKCFEDHRYRSDRKNKTLSDDELERLWLNSYNYNQYKEVKSRKYMERIIFWAAWWPFSVVYTVAGDYILRLFRTIYEHFEGYFDMLINYFLKRIIAKSEAKVNVAGASANPPEGESEVPES